MLSKSTRMRIAIYHGLPPGGAKRTVYEHTRWLSKRHSLSLFTLGSTNDSLLDARLFAKENTAVHFTPTKVLSSPLGRLNNAIRIADLLRLRVASSQIADSINAGSYNVVLVHPCQYAHTPWILHFLESPSVYYCQEHHRQVYEQSLERPYSNRSRWRRMIDRIDPLTYIYFRILVLIEKQGLRSANRILVNSQYIQDKVRQIYGLHTYVNYHGIDPQEFPALDLPRSEYVLSVGVLLPRKGFDFIIEGLGYLPAHFRPRLVLVSYIQSHEERTYLEALAAERQVQLEFIIMADHKRLIELYNRALLTIYTPYYEAFGLVPLESMACGTPVIGIDEAGVRETVLDGVTGRLVPRDPNALAEAMSGLLNNGALRVDMGRAGRDYMLREWTWDQAISKLEDHLYEVARVDA